MARDLRNFKTAETAKLLERAEINVRSTRRAGADQLQIALEWTTAHIVNDEDEDTHTSWIGATRTAIYEYAPAELAAVMSTHPLSARKLMADAIDAYRRLPHTWAAVQALELEAWVARKIVTLTHELDARAARQVDAAIADDLASLPTGRILSLTEARVVEADTDLANEKAEQHLRRRMVSLGRTNEYGVRGLVARMESADAVRLFAAVDGLARRMAEVTDDEDPEPLDALRARALAMLADPKGALAFIDGANPGRSKSVIYVHTTADFWVKKSGIARVETAFGCFAATRDMIGRFLRHDHVTVRPVIDLADQVSSDCYEIPADISDRLHLIKPADVFPFANSTSRTMDRDHTVPWPLGKTSVDNLGLMTRTHHRIKTHAAGWDVEQIDGHRYLWRTPHGRYFLTDQRGTHRIPVMRHPTSRLELEFSELLLEVS